MFQGQGSWWGAGQLQDGGLAARKPWLETRNVGAHPDPPGGREGLQVELARDRAHVTKLPGKSHAQRAEEASGCLSAPTCQDGMHPKFTGAELLSQVPCRACLMFLFTWLFTGTCHHAPCKIISC